MAILQKNKEGVFKPAGQATVINPQTGEKKVVQVGDPNAFAGGFQLYNPNQPIKKLPVPSPIDNRGPAQPPQPQTPDPLTTFNTAILDMLRQAQGQSGNQDLYGKQRGLQREAISRTMAPTSEALSHYSPDVQNAQRDQSISELQPEADAIAATIKSNDSRLRNFESILGQMREIGSDFVKNLAPSPEILDGYRKIIKSGGDVASIPTEIRSKVIGSLTDEDWTANQRAKLKSQKKDTQVVEVGGQRILIDAQTGQTIKVLGASPRSGGGDLFGLPPTTIPQPLQTGKTFEQYITEQEQAAGQSFSPSKREALRQQFNTQNPQTGNTNQSILVHTGLSVPAFNYLTQGTASLSRLSEATRRQIINEAGNFLNKNGIDYSTFQSRFKASNEVLEKNVARFNNVQIAEGELKGTIENLTMASQEAGLNDVRAYNAAKKWIKGQFNDADVQKYAFHLNQLKSELAYYNAASMGRNSTDVIDINEAEKVLQQGIAAGSLSGLQSALERSVEKMGITLKSSVDRANKQVWDLFGVGSKYQPTASASKQQSSSAQDILNKYGVK